MSLPGGGGDGKRTGIRPASGERMASPESKVKGNGLPEKDAGGTPERKEARSHSSGHKLALLAVMDYLLRETDEEHPVNAAGLRTMLASRGLMEDRRTIYTDIALLSSYGLDILKAEGRTGGWYIGSRKFEMPELKLLVDAVQASKFITEKKTRDLIRKLETETSVFHALELNREVYIASKAKSGNENIFYIIDSIHEAIRKNVQIVFQYGYIDTRKKLVPRKGGARYQLSPWALVWQDENYYLIAYDADVRKIKHFRVDKIVKMTVLEGEERTGGDLFRAFSLEEYLKKTFRMFSGEDTELTLRCADYLAGVVTERFGQDVLLMPAGEGFFRVTVEVSVSPQFYGWLAGLGDSVELISPEKTRIAYRNYLLGLAARYGEPEGEVRKEHVGSGYEET